MPKRKVGNVAVSSLGSISSGSGTRTPQACLNCRRRKSKCDGFRPCCFHCTKRKEDCKWPELQQSAPFVSPNVASAVGNPGPSIAANRNLPPALLDHLLDLFYRHHHDVEFCGFIHKPSFDIQQSQSSFIGTAIVALSALSLSNEETRQNTGYQSAAQFSHHYMLRARIFSQDLSRIPSVSSIQANLILSLCEILSLHDTGYWMTSGVALRMVFAMRLGKEYNQQHSAREKETRRRIFWASLLMDRLIAMCDCRPQVVRKRNITIQLPCPEATYAYEDEHKGIYLQDLLSNAHNVSQVGILPYLLTTVVLWGDLADCFGAGGRANRYHNLPPTDPESIFYKAEKALVDWTSSLPEKMQWSMSNYRLHQGIGYGKIFATIHLLLRHGLCVAHHEYLPQLESPTNLLDSFDGAGLSFYHHDDTLISTCVASANAITEIASLLFHGTDQDRANLQSPVAANAFLSAICVHLWSQYVSFTQNEAQGDPLLAKSQYDLLRTITATWCHQWKIASAWLETFDMLLRLYDCAYGGRAGLDVMLLEEPVTEVHASPSPQNGESEAQFEASNGNGLPEPAVVRQRLYDKIRFIIITPLASSEYKERLMRICLGTLWQHMTLPDLFEDFGSTMFENNI